MVTVWVWAALHLLPGYQGPSFHDWHHRSSAGNYANLFIWFDRWFGTISPGYLDD